MSAQGLFDKALQQQDAAQASLTTANLELMQVCLMFYPASLFLPIYKGGGSDIKMTCLLGHRTR